MLYWSRIGSRVLQVRLCGFRHISTSGFCIRTSRASFIAFLPISCVRYRVSRPLRLRLTLNDARWRYFRFWWVLRVRLWFSPYFYFRFERSASWVSFIAVFGRPLQVTVRPMLLTILLSVLSVTLVYCGQTVGWIRMPLSTEIGLGPGDIVLDGDPTQLPHRKGRSSPHFSGHVYCGQTVAHISNCWGLVWLSIEKRKFCHLSPWSLTMTLIPELDLDRVKMNQCAKHLGQRSFPSTVIVRTQTHTADRLHSADHKVVNKD